MSTCIQGLGLAVPKHFINQAEAAHYALASCVASDKQRQLATRLYLRSGVESRHSVLLNSSTNGETAAQSYYEPSTETQPFGPTTAERMQTYRSEAEKLAIEAAGKALLASGVEPAAITHVVTVSCSGFDAPGVDVSLITELGLKQQVARTHVGFMGCHGAMNGLRVAKAYANADPNVQVLLVAVELCSLHYQYEWTNERMVSNSLFADGAAAVVVSNAEQSKSLWSIGESLAEIVPESRDAMTWRIGDHGFEMTLSPAVPQLIKQELRPRLEAWLSQGDLSLDQIAGWAVHPGGPRILQACSEALSLPDSALAASFDVLRRFGNMSSPTVLFVLHELEQQITGPTVALGFGPGLAIEGCLLYR
ncbi:type III polyketide synthase [Aeoliella mucimassa]|nr:type III polyketide synthase [Aeoliella mucimassa]